MGTLTEDEIAFIKQSLINGLLNTVYKEAEKTIETWLEGVDINEIIFLENPESRLEFEYM